MTDDPGFEATRPLGPTGRTLAAGRYELRGLVGQGGMADVELALDTLLDRLVAVKLLHARYADDPDFLARFRREAQAAASLNHPNIVSVYDTGSDDGRPFIVMEYVTGRNLRDLMRREDIQVPRAIQIAGDSALGLHYAHERGLIHRDIKPGNILVSEEGVVKVTDFGIARAINAENVTQTAAVFGTAAYIAPEQAQGQTVDRRTDVYALGCVLYELLTHAQPFAADSAVALAYKHISEAPTPPSQTNPDIGPQLDAVVMKALAKDPADRYQTARDFAEDLGKAAEGRTVLAQPAATYATTQAIVREPERTMVVPAPVLPVERPYERRERVLVAEEPPRRDNTLRWILLTLLLLALFGGVAYLFATSGATPTPATTPTPLPSLSPSIADLLVPDLVGQPVAAAEAALVDAGFTVIIGPAVNDPADAGTVVDQEPPATTPVPPGSPITLVPSGGPATVPVPDVSGFSAEDAGLALEQAGFELGDPVTQANDEVEADAVIGTNPSAGSAVAPGTVIQVIVSAGPAAFNLPNVVGLSLDDATEVLVNQTCDDPPCVEIDVVDEQFSTSIAEGAVIRISPVRITRGGTVEVTVSLGPEEVPTVQPTTAPTATFSATPVPTTSAVPTVGVESPTPSLSPSPSPS